MNITAGAIVVIVILILVGFCFFFNSKIGKRVRIRASGTANEAIQKDAATPEGAKAYYNAAIEKKEDELQQENVRYQQMLGKISNYEDDLFHLKKDAMKADVNVNACVDRGDDEAAKVYLKEQQELNDKIDFIKNTLKEWKENADVQKEKVEVFNIGTGRGVSVLELINGFEKATGVKLNYQIVGRRAGDIEKVWANPDYANQELGWKAVETLEDTLRSAWNWQLKLRERGIQ